MTDRRGTNRSRPRVLEALFVVAIAASACRAPSASEAKSASAKEKPVTVETIDGSPTKRVRLSAKAAERLDIQTGTVSEQAIPHTQVVGAIVVDPSAGGGETQGASGSALWVRLALSPPEWERLAKDAPARIFPLQTRPSLPKDLTATPIGQPPVETAKSGMLSMFYAVPANTPGLVIGDRVRAELQFDGGSETHKVVPYSAVYYDAKGDAWVYVNTAPLTFVRQQVGVARVAGDLALLSSGPDVGTRVATVGVSLLYGSEILGK